MEKDTKLRTIVKTIGFKILTTSVTALVIGLKGAIFIHVLMTIIYLVYERVWNNVNWGKVASGPPGDEAKQ